MYVMIPKGVTTVTIIVGCSTSVIPHCKDGSHDGRSDTSCLFSEKCHWADYRLGKASIYTVTWNSVTSPQMNMEKRDRKLNSPRTAHHGQPLFLLQTFVVWNFYTTRSKEWRFMSQQSSARWATSTILPLVQCGRVIHDLLQCFMINYPKANSNFM
jgi:hypothetical protein